MDSVACLEWSRRDKGTVIVRRPTDLADGLLKS